MCWRILGHILLSYWRSCGRWFTVASNIYKCTSWSIKVKFHILCWGRYQIFWLLLHPKNKSLIPFEAFSWSFTVVFAPTLGFSSSCSSTGAPVVWGRDPTRRRHISETIPISGSQDVRHRHDGESPQGAEYWIRRRRAQKQYHRVFDHILDINPAKVVKKCWCFSALNVEADRQVAATCWRSCFAQWNWLDWSVRWGFSCAQENISDDHLCLCRPHSQIYWISRRAGWSNWTQASR